MGALRCLIIGAIALGMSASALAAKSTLHIQFAEKVQIPAAVGHVDFDAYGRRFSVDLESNDRLLGALPVTSKSGIARNRLFRGKLQDVPGSWVRIAKYGDGVEGAIWDGHDIYVVTSQGRIAANLVQPVEGAPSQTVVYRLSDTSGGLPDQFCGVERGLPASKIDAPSALEQYGSVIADLRANIAGATALDQIDVSIITDAAFAQHYGNLAHDEILSRLNIVDGIFNEQVGVLIVPSELRSTPASPDPFNSNDPETLLENLADYRAATPEVRASGLAHLMTGRDLDGNVVGIAFRNSLCDPRDGVSLSDSSFGFWGGLVMAHELGHNFGAEHDGVPGSACASTPQNFLMAPTINFSSQFSACSLQSMRTPIELARGRCISAPHYAGLTIDVPPSPYLVDTAQPFSLPVTVHSTGNLVARNAMLRLDLPSQITFQSAGATSCQVTGAVVLCPLGDLAAGQDRDVDFRLVGGTLGSYNVAVTVEADNDYLRSDNVKTVQLGLQSSIDAGLTMTSSPADIFVNDLIELDFDVSSLRSQPVRNAQLSIRIDNLQFDSIVAGAHSCLRNANDISLIQCQLSDIAPGTSTRIIVRARAPYPGFRSASAFVSAPNDGNSSNDWKEVSFTVRAEREVNVVASAESLRVVTGTPYEITYTLTTRGRLPVDNVTFLVSPPWSGAVLSVTPSAGTCGAPVPQHDTTCAFGTLTPGDLRTVVVRIQIDSIGTSGVNGRAHYLDGQLDNYISAFTWIYSYLRVDASLSGYASQVNEGETGSGRIDIQSVGFDPAQNVVVTVDLPVPARLTQLTINNNTTTFQCEVLTPQRGRCSGSFSSFQINYVSADYTFTSDIPLDGVVRFELTADNDGEPSNNVSEAPLHVWQYLDVGVASNSPAFSVLLGETSTVDFTVTTGHNPVPAVRLDVPGNSPFVEPVSVRVNGADCPLTNPFGAPTANVCGMGNLPANASIPVTVTYRALQTEGDAYVYVTASTARDSNYSNNQKLVPFTVYRMTDVQLSVASSSATALNGATLGFPRITVTNGAGIARNVTVQIPLPAFAQVASISSNGMCTGTTSLSCVLPFMSAGGSASIDISLLGNRSGTFTSDITMTAANDSTAGNNTASVTLSVTAPPTGGGGSSGGGSSGGGGGGGGRMEWLALALLGSLALRRILGGVAALDELTRGEADAPRR